MIQQRSCSCAEGLLRDYFRYASKNGFTLVELAIALMVIGLLIGGVLKGQELIENAKITAAIRQIEAYNTAAMIFRSSYNAVPGDMKKPGSRIPNCDTGSCNVGGNGNRLIGRAGASADPNYRIEQANFFVHLTKAGLIQGVEGGSTAQAESVHNTPASTSYELFYPRFAIDSVQRFEARFVSLGAAHSEKDGNKYIGPKYLIHPLEFKQAEQLDTKLDDGYPCSGEMYNRNLPISSACAADKKSSYEDVGDKLHYLQVGF